jgi:hypothetical protein
MSDFRPDHYPSQITEPVLEIPPVEPVQETPEPEPVETAPIENNKTGGTIMSDSQSRWLEISGDASILVDGQNVKDLLTLPIFDVARNESVHVAIDYDPSRDRLSVTLKKV